MSTLKRSETGPSSSTFQREERAAHEEVVDVAPEYERLRYPVDGLVACEYTRIRVRLLESPGFQPREERSLPTAASLSHAVHRLDCTAHAGAPVGSGGLVSWRGVAVHNFTRL
eukprot:797159-Pleurochrysis_carterae.AAC.3